MPPVGTRTKGILELCDERELRGVLAHELSHVTNRDILIGSIAAAIGMSIVLLSRFAFFFGGGDDRDNNFGLIGMLIAWILAPLAAAVIQMAVSRSREYQADESGAHLSHDPEALASALRKLEMASKRVPPPASGAHVHRQPLQRAQGAVRQPVLHPPADGSPHRTPGGDRPPAHVSRNQPAVRA